MKAEEIRKLFETKSMTDAAEQEPKIVAVMQLVALGEIAAQLAELNDYLKNSRLGKEF